MWRLLGTDNWIEINKYRKLKNGKKLFVARTYSVERCKQGCIINEGKLFVLIAGTDSSQIYCINHSPYEVEVNK